MKVIFFDGVCGLCNGFVDFIMKIYKEGKFKFSPLQSDYAAKNLPPEFIQDLKSVVYLDEGKLSQKSDAVLKILSEIGGIWSVVKLGQLLPTSLRNKAYDLVASNRYKVFGKKETCRLPSPQERSRFVS